MKDPNQQNDPLEEFFRKKAGEYDEITYREEDWLKLEKKIEVRQLQALNRKRMAWAAAAAFLILSLLGYFTYQNHLDISELNELLSQDTTPGQFEELRPATPGDFNAEESGNESSETDIDPESPSGLTSEESEPSAIARSATPADVSMTPFSAEPIPDRTSPGNIPVWTNGEQDGIEREAVAAAGFSCLSCLPAGPENPENSYALVTRPEETDPIHRTMDNMFAVTTPVEAPRLSGTFAADGSFVPDRTSGFSLSVTASPDLSTAGSVSNFTHPGFKAGLAVEYRLNRHLSVSAGMIHSTVHYQAFGRDYRPSQGPLYSGTSPEKTTAECALLDLPITMKVDMIRSDRSRFFATAGLSSYIMLNEEYRFRYPEGQTGPDSWQDRTGTRHWLSNAGFSVGYEYDLMPDWSIRVEPYIRVPLSEVGWGEVKLYSMGSFVSLNYQLNR